MDFRFLSTYKRSQKTNKIATFFCLCMVSMPTEKTQSILHALPIRILLVDAHPITLLGLSTLLSDNSNYEIVSKLNSASHIVETLKLKQPDLVLMDLHLPGVDGIKLVQEVQAVGGGALKVVILAAALSETETCEIIRSGVKGILLKEMPAVLIMQCLQRVHSGGEWMERNSMKLAFEQILWRESGYQTIAVQLTPSEMSLATLIAMGHNNKSAARQLQITEGSARVYLTRIYNKLQVPNRLQLALLFKEKGLV